MAGLGILTLALLLAALLGQYQQYVYGRFGRQWREGMFFSHFLALPAFLFVSADIHDESVLYSNSELVSVGLVIEGIISKIPLLKALYLSYGGESLRILSVPILWLFLVLNVLTQYVCIAGVSKLTSMTSSVTVNLVLPILQLGSLCT